MDKSERLKPQVVKLLKRAARREGLDAKKWNALNSLLLIPANAWVSKVYIPVPLKIIK